MSMENDKYLNESLKKIVKGAGISFTGTVIGTAFGYLARMIIGRFLGPSEYGIVSIGFVVMTIAATLSLVGLNAGIQRYVSFYKGKGDERRIKGTIIGALKISFPLSLILTFLIFLGADWISIHVFHEPNLTPVLRIFAIGIPFWVLTTIFNSGSVGFQEIKYKVYTIFIFKDTFKLIAIVTLLALGYGILGASVGWVIAIILSSFLAFYFLEHKVFSILNSRVTSISVDKELLLFSFPLIFAGLAALITSYTDTLMLGYFCTSSEVGVYNAAMPTASLLLIISGSFTVIFMPVVSELHARGMENELKKSYSSVTKWVFSLVLPAFILIAFFSDSIMCLMFGSEYIVGATALRVLAFGYFIFSLFSLASSLLQSYGKTGIVMKCSFIGAGANIILNFLLIPVYGVNGAAIATTVSLVLLGILYFLFIYRIKKIQPIKLSYAKPLFASLIALLVIYMMIKYMGYLSLSLLMCAFFVFLILYFVLLLIFRSFEEEDLIIMRAIDERFGIKSNRICDIIKRFL